MVGLPNSEKILKICLFILTECTNVTDEQTDTAWRQRLHLMLASHGKNENDEMKISKQQLNSNRQQTWQPFKNNSEVFADP